MPTSQKRGQKTALELLTELDFSLFWEQAKSSLNETSWINSLYAQRGKGRNDYPIELLWESLLKVAAFRLAKISDLSQINAQVLPPPSSFSRFITSALKQIERLDQMLFDLSDVGSIIALGTLVDTYKRHTYLYNVETELPFYWHTGPKENSSVQQAFELLKKIPSHKAQFLIATAEYETLAGPLWEHFKIKPIIPRLHTQTEKKSYKDVLYDYLGQPYCHEASMVYVGFEESRNSLKFRCAADHYGYQCSTYDQCKLRKGIRIPLDFDPDTFTPLPRFSYRWERLESLSKKEPQIRALLLKSVPSLGNKAFFLRIISLLYAAAYRTKNVSKCVLN